MGLYELLKIIFVYPLLNLLILIYYAFSGLGIPGALGWSILVLTFLFKIATQPLFIKQIKQAKVMQELAPKIKKLQNKYKNNPAQLQKEQMKLYTQAGVNPAGGCLILLIQVPFIYALYNAFLIFLNVENNGGFQSLQKIIYFSFINLDKIETMFLGFDLTISPSVALSRFGGSAWHYLLIPFITGFLQYYFSKTSFANVSQTSENKEEVAKKNKSGSDSDPAEDFSRIMQFQTKYLFPVLIGWVSMSFPVGLALYWNAFSFFSILQSRMVSAKS
ncbi:MAG: membrane protein [Patescibacteria group bacterium]|nr:MAG: membrane protein [Patescibacteria group bacterium]